MNSSNLLSEIRLRELKGIGDKTEKLFGKVGIDNLDQLIHYYPRAYDACRECVAICDMVPGEKQSVKIQIKRPPTVKNGGRTAITILNADDMSGKLEIIWFNMPYLRSILKAGSIMIFRGMVIQKNGHLCMEHPEIFSLNAYEEIKGTIRPIYSLTAGLKNKVVAKAVTQVLEKYTFFEYLPERMLNDNRLVTREKAINSIHFPHDEKELSMARRRIVFDEFLFYLLRLKRMSNDRQETINRYKVTETRTADSIIKNLPFELTGAQTKAWNDIKNDIMSEHTMNRLMQGDVGSGKTIVAILAVTAMMEAGFQSAIMAPTEVLAVQHYRTLVKLFEDNGIPSDRVKLLTGSMTASQKKKAYEEIRNAGVDIVVGTHAIIQDKVEFKELGLVITDEQHRFGVRQRGLISLKGNEPHVLVMSATPIPRTLALIMFGDLSISVIDELPKKRLKIKNCVVNTSYRKTAYEFMKKQIEDGHQVYIICPMIEPNENLGCENVFEYTSRIKKFFSSDIRCEMLHGRMSADEKNSIMERFSNGDIDILVSTTVVEVGVDVPNSTVMLIENSERFGLAQLHQLRGRIGRGSAQSYCIFMKSDSSEETDKRLEIISNSNDGFYIAREDLKLRGQGDLFGLRQSGEAAFSMADIFTDSEILEKASAAAGKILEEDPMLESDKYKKLKEALAQAGSEAEGIL